MMPIIIIFFCLNGNCSISVHSYWSPTFALHLYLCGCVLLRDQYGLCRSFKTLSPSVLFRFLHSLAIMRIIWSVNVIKLKWNIYTVPFAENLGLGKWMCVSDISQHTVGCMWFIDICWHQCVYLKKSRSLYKCKWEMTFRLFPRWE